MYVRGMCYIIHDFRSTVEGAINSAILLANIDLAVFKMIDSIATPSRYISSN